MKILNLIATSFLIIGCSCSSPDLLKNENQFNCITSDETSADLNALRHKHPEADAFVQSAGEVASSDYLGMGALSLYVLINIDGKEEAKMRNQLNHFAKTAYMKIKDESDLTPFQKRFIEKYEKHFEIEK